MIRYVILTIICTCFINYNLNAQSFEDGELIGFSQFRLDEMMKTETWDNIEYEGIHDEFELVIYTYVGSCCTEIYGKEIENIALYYSTENDPKDLFKPSGSMRLSQIHLCLEPFKKGTLQDILDKNELTNEELKAQMRTVDSLTQNIQRKINTVSDYNPNPKYLKDQAMYVWNLEEKIIVLNLNFASMYVGFKPVIQIISQSNC